METLSITWKHKLWLKPLDFFPLSWPHLNFSLTLSLYYRTSDGFHFEHNAKHVLNVKYLSPKFKQIWVFYWRNSHSTSFTNLKQDLPNQGNEEKAGVYYNYSAGVWSIVCKRKARHFWKRQVSLPSPLLLWPAIESFCCISSNNEWDPWTRGWEYKWDMVPVPRNSLANERWALRRETINFNHEVVGP